MRYRDFCDLCSEKFAGEVATSGTGVAAARALSTLQRRTVLGPANASVQKAALDSPNNSCRRGDQTVPESPQSANVASAALEQEPCPCETPGDSQQEPFGVDEILDLIRTRVHQGRLQNALAGSFRSFSTTHWAKPGHVNNLQFRRCMDTLGIGLTEVQLSVLFRAFDDTDMGNEFNYVKFLRCVMPPLPHTTVRPASVQSQPKKGESIMTHRSPYFDARVRVRSRATTPTSCTSTTRSSRGSTFKWQVRPAGVHQPHPGLA